MTAYNVSTTHAPKPVIKPDLCPPLNDFWITRIAIGPIGTDAHIPTMNALSISRNIGIENQSICKRTKINKFLHIFAVSDTTENEKGKHIVMGTRTAVCSIDVCPISRTSYRLSCIIRTDPPSVHGQDSGHAGEEKGLDISLQCIRIVECNHYILGMQCHNRRRIVRHFCKFPPDVAESVEGSVFGQVSEKAVFGDV